MSSQYASALLRIREMILRGALVPGQRLSESALAEMLGMTRTPVRQALPALAREGLVAANDTRGFIVRSFSEAEISDAIDVRGVLEGLAARQLAQKGISKALLRGLRECLEDGDRILGKGRLIESDEGLYSEMNVRFHSQIVEGAGSTVISQALERNNLIPFAGPQALAFAKSDLETAYKSLVFSHMQHHAIVDALNDGDGARVDIQMREHATTVKATANIARQKFGMPGREDVEKSRAIGAG